MGEAYTPPDGCTIIPVSKVSFGFVTGGGEYNDKKTKEETGLPFAGGCASGITISPVAFLVADKNGIKLMSSNPKSAFEKIVDNAPQIITEIKSVLNCNCCKDEEAEVNEEQT